MQYMCGKWEKIRERELQCTRRFDFDKTLITIEKYPLDGCARGCRSTRLKRRCIPIIRTSNNNIYARNMYVYPARITSLSYPYIIIVSICFRRVITGDFRILKNTARVGYVCIHLIYLYRTLCVYSRVIISTIKWPMSCIYYYNKIMITCRLLLPFSLVLLFV